MGEQSTSGKHSRRRLARQARQASTTGVGGGAVVGPGSGVGPAFGPDIGTGTGVVKALLGVLVGNNCGVCGIGESEGDGVRSTAVAAAVVLLTAALVGRSVGTRRSLRLAISHDHKEKHQSW